MRSELIKSRKELRLSQRSIAHEVGISTSFYWSIEKGDNNPSYGLALEIAKAVKRKATDIFLDLGDFKLKLWRKKSSRTHRTG